MDEIDETEDEIDQAELDMIESRRLQAQNEKLNSLKSKWQKDISTVIENQRDSVGANIVSMSTSKFRMGNKETSAPTDQTQLDMMESNRLRARFEKHGASESEKRNTTESTHLYLVAASDIPKSEPIHDQVTQLLNTLGIFWEERGIVRSKALAILNWGQIRIQEDMGYDIALTWLRAKYSPRFAAIENMIYRDYLWIHQQRVAWFLGQAFSRIRETFPEIRLDYIQIFPGRHDIIDWISPFWHISTPLKWKLWSDSKNLLNEIKQKLWAIYFKNFPIIGFPEHSDEVLNDIISKVSIESKITSYFDKLDGLMTCFHELVAGNESFLEPFHNYINILRNIRDWEELPEIQQLLLRGSDISSKEDSVFYIDNIIEQSSRIDKFFWKCTTSESMEENIRSDFGFPAYGKWKEWIMFSSYQFSMRYWDWKDVLVYRWREPDLPEVLKGVA